MNNKSSRLVGVRKHRDGTAANIQLVANLERAPGDSLDFKSGEFGNHGTPLADGGGSDPQRPRDIRGLLKVIENVTFEHDRPFTTLKRGLQAHASSAVLTSLNMENLPDLASRLRAAMRDAGVSNIELARECGVSPAAVTRWLKGEIRKLKADNYASAARALGVREEWLRAGKLPRERDARSLDVERATAAFLRMREPLRDLMQILDHMEPTEPTTDQKRRHGG